MAGLQIPNPSITSGAFASMLAFSSDNNTITAISGHPIAGVGGGGTPVEGYWRPSVNTDGDISWAWSLESTSTVPSTANIKGPQGIQGETGPQGPSGTNGKDGTNGTNGYSVELQSVTDEDGGKKVTLSWGATPSTSSFVIPSGAKGADGQNGQNGTDGKDGISPTFTTSVTSDAQHQHGGTHVVISGAAGESAFNVWNGNDGEGASVNLFGNNGVSVTKDGTNYTVGLSGGYYSDTLSAYSAMYAGYANKASEAQGFRWGDNSYQDTSAALTELWHSKNHVTLQTANNILTVDNNDNTSATLSAMSYVNNTLNNRAFLPQKACVCLESEITTMATLANGQGMLFFVVSAHQE